MSREIRQLHQQQNTFTNFSNSQSTQQDSDDPNSDPPRRRRRRRSDDSQVNDSNISQSDSQSDEQLSPVKALTAISSFLQDDISSVRAELTNDAYHSSLAPSDFSDDTHDWDGDSHSISDDYWHFLGSFE